MIWSYILDYENESNPYANRKNSILKWKYLSKEDIEENSDILKDAYNRSMDDFIKVTKGKPIPFKDWMRIFFSTNIYNC